MWIILTSKVPFKDNLVFDLLNTSIWCLFGFFFNVPQHTIYNHISLLIISHCHVWEFLLLFCHTPVLVNGRWNGLVVTVYNTFQVCLTSQNASRLSHSHTGGSLVLLAHYREQFGVQSLARGHLGTLNAGVGTRTTNPGQPDVLIEPWLARRKPKEPILMTCGVGS